MPLIVLFFLCGDQLTEDYQKLRPFCVVTVNQKFSDFPVKISLTTGARIPQVVRADKAATTFSDLA
ncbi:MAG: hypothetical protein AAF340_07315 [Pseudomonadota bacterium]